MDGRVLWRLMAIFNSVIKRGCLMGYFASAVSVCSWWSQAALGAPAIFWASDPVNPGETALVVGQDLTETTEVRIERLRDGRDSPEKVFEPEQNVVPVRKTEKSVYFVIPERLESGVYRFELVTPHGVAFGLLNRPSLYWAQGDRGSAASPGGELRVFGRCIGLASAATAALENLDTGERFLVPLRERSLWSARALIPPFTPPGKYRVSVWNGRGGLEAWSTAVPLEIKPMPTRPTRQVSAKDFGAKGDGKSDDTGAIESALSDLSTAGGVLLIPPGEYLISRTLSIPPGVTVRGADRNLTSLMWLDFDTPPETLLQGAHDFSLENITLYASNLRHFISGGFLQGEPAAGNIHIRNIYLRASAYRGHIDDKAKERRRLSLVTGAGGPNGGDAIRLRGDNLEVVDSDIYASTSSLFILDSQGIVLERNVFQNGRDGWYSISGSRDVVIEDNEFVGADLGASGGSINTLFSSTGASENIWLGRNRFRLMSAWDREAMTTDSPGGSYFGAIVRAEGRRLWLEAPLTNGPRSLVGQGVFVLGGDGAGQFAQIESADGNVLTLDRSWTVAADTTSRVTITPMVQNYLIVDNEFSDAGVAVQFYGTSVNNVVAGNTSSRTAGFLNRGEWYHHYEPSWYNQYLDNSIVDGAVYRGGPDNSIFAGEAVIGAYGMFHAQNDPPLVLGVIMRRNRLSKNSRIELQGCTGSKPLLSSAVIEKNIVLNDIEPIRGQYPDCDVLVHENFFGR